MSPVASSGSGWEAVSTESQDVTVPWLLLQLRAAQGEHSAAQRRVRKITVLILTGLAALTGCLAYAFLPTAGGPYSMVARLGVSQLNEGTLHLPKDATDGIYINNVNIDIETQNGFTANLDASAHVTNDMSDSLYGNNGAVSLHGNVKRLNGAYDNNAEASSGDVTRANGAMDNNALTDYGNVYRQNGISAGNGANGPVTATDEQQLFTGEPGSGSPTSVGASPREKSSDHEEQPHSKRDEDSAAKAGPAKANYSALLHTLLLVGELQEGFATEDNPPEEMEVDAQGHGRMRDMVRIARRLINQTGNKTSGNETSRQRVRDLHKLIGWWYATKAATAEQRKTHLREAAEILYGRNNSKDDLDSKLPAQAFKFFEKAINATTLLAKAQEKVVNDTMLQLSSMQNASSKIAQAAVQNAASNQSEMLKAEENEIHAIFDSIGRSQRQGGANGSQPHGPVVIQNVNIKIRHQNGFQTNIEAKADVENDMSGALHDNNAAVSKDGDVLRANGVYDNNANSKNGSVLRVNGVFDNNARTGYGDVKRQNGVDIK